MPAMIGSPSSGLLPISRGSESSLSACSSVDVVRRHALGQAGALGLHGLAVRVLGRLAELQIAAEAAAAHGDFKAGVRILAELAHAAALAVGADGELAGELAFRIVGAADEAAEPAELEADPAVRAVRALARIAAVLARREQVRRQHLVERVDHLRDAQLLDVVDRADEVASRSRAAGRARGSRCWRPCRAALRGSAVKSYST